MWFRGWMIVEEPCLGSVLRWAPRARLLPPVLTQQRIFTPSFNVARLDDNMKTVDNLPYTLCRQGSDLLSQS
jgi:hypothetical protein